MSTKETSFVGAKRCVAIIIIHKYYIIWHAYADIFPRQMSAKYPEDTVTFRRDRGQEVISDYMYPGSGEPPLVMWRRRPYDTVTYSFPPQRGNEGGAKVCTVLP